MIVWVIGRGYPTKENRMWGLFELEQAKLLAAHGHRVCYLALTLSFFSRGDARGLSAFDEDGVHVFHCSRLFFPGKTGVYIERFEDACWERLTREAERITGCPDVIHVHYPAMVGNINVMERYRERGASVVATEHWSRVLTGNMKAPDRKRLAYYAAHASALTAVSEVLLHAIERSVEVTVPTGVLPNTVSSLFAPGEVPHHGFRFLVVCRLEPLKQVDEIIRAFQAEFSGETDVSLHIVGSGSELKKLRGAAAASGERVSFTGTLPVEDVAEEVRACDALVSFSQYETFGVPVIEAWACGKPAIVSDTSGVAPYVTGKVGLVVDHSDSGALRSAMRHIRDAAASYSAEHIASYCSETFGPERLYQRLMDLYQKQ